jgi:hypothetical protein
LLIETLWSEFWFPRMKKPAEGLGGLRNVRREVELGCRRPGTSSIPRAQQRRRLRASASDGGGRDRHDHGASHKAITVIVNGVLADR